MKQIIKIISIALCMATTSTTAQTYTEDLSDISRSENPVSPIGNLGSLEKIIDLRGFVPFSFYSKSMTAKQNIFTSRESNRWFKIPTRIGTQTIYYGLEDTENTTKDTPIITETNISEPDKKWALLAYDIAAQQGKELYKFIGKGSGYEGCEPILILQTQESTFIVFNIRYSDWDSNGTGQYLAGMEFSRSLMRYKTFYMLYSDAMFSKSTRELFSATAPLVNGALKAFTSQ